VRATTHKQTSIENYSCDHRLLSIIERKSMFDIRRRGRVTTDKVNYPPANYPPFFAGDIKRKICVFYD